MLKSFIQKATQTPTAMRFQKGVTWVDPKVSQDLDL